MSNLVGNNGMSMIVNTSKKLIKNLLLLIEFLNLMLNKKKRSPNEVSLVLAIDQSSYSQQ